MSAGYRTSVIFAVLVFLNLYSRIPHAWLLGWFFAASGIAVARFLVSRRFQQTSPPETYYRRWMLLGILLIALQSLSWIAVLGMVEYTRHPLDIAFAVFLICALTFGGLASFGFHLRAYLVFTVPLFGVFWVWLLLFSVGEAPWLPVTVAFGSLAIFDSALNSMRMIRRTLELSYEREDLARRLAEEKELAEVSLLSIGDGVLTDDIDGMFS